MFTINFRIRLVFTCLLFALVFFKIAFVYGGIDREDLFRPQGIAFKGKEKVYIQKDSSLWESGEIYRVILSLKAHVFSYQDRGVIVRQERRVLIHAESLEVYTTDERLPFGDPAGGVLIIDSYPSHSLGVASQFFIDSGKKNLLMIESINYHSYDVEPKEERTLSFYRPIGNGVKHWREKSLSDRHWQGIALSPSKPLGATSNEGETSNEQPSCFQFAASIALPAPSASGANAQGHTMTRLKTGMPFLPLEERLKRTIRTSRHLEAEQVRESGSESVVMHFIDMAKSIKTSVNLCSSYRSRYIKQPGMLRKVRSGSHRDHIVEQTIFSPDGKLERLEFSLDERYPVSLSFQRKK